MIAAITAIAFLIIVPKEKYKHFLLWGLVFGGLGDATVVALLNPLNLIKYRNMGPFNIFGLFSFFTPITWAFVFSIYFYLLPIKVIFLIPYIIAFVGANYAQGLVMEQLELFRYIGIHRYLAVPTFLIWYGVSALVYRKYGQESKKESFIPAIEYNRTYMPKVHLIKPSQKFLSLTKRVRPRFVKPKKIK